MSEGFKQYVFTTSLICYNISAHLCYNNACTQTVANIGRTKEVARMKSHTLDFNLPFRIGAD